MKRAFHDNQPGTIELNILQSIGKPKEITQKGYSGTTPEWFASTPELFELHVITPQKRTDETSPIGRARAAFNS